MERGKLELISIMEVTEKLSRVRRDFETNMAILDRLYPYGQEEADELLV